MDRLNAESQNERQDSLFPIKYNISYEEFYSYNSINLAYATNNLGGITYWDFVFGLKRIRLYCDQLNAFPSEVTSLKDLEYLIVYEMAEKVKKDLQGIPEIYRKKVIYNRLERKYQNKYFYTLTQEKPIISIQAEEHIRHKLNSIGGDESYQFKIKD